jgi:hypothetical protein
VGHLVTKLRHHGGQELDNFVGFAILTGHLAQAWKIHCAGLPLLVTWQVGLNGSNQTYSLQVLHSRCSWKFLLIPMQWDPVLNYMPTLQSLDSWFQCTSLCFR